MLRWEQRVATRIILAAAPISKGELLPDAPVDPLAQQVGVAGRRRT
jgi:hypothetical protein